MSFLLRGRDGRPPLYRYLVYCEGVILDLAVEAASPMVQDGTRNHQPRNMMLLSAFEVYPYYKLLIKFFTQAYVLTIS